MRIAFLHPTYWPEVRRGSERLVHDLASGLAGRGHEVTLITSHPGRPTVNEEDGFRVIRNWRLPYMRPLRWYEDHARENIESPGFLSARRFAVTPARDNATRLTHLALYEYEGEMERWRGYQAVPGGWGRSVVAIGNFDGVHRGHQAIIGHTVKEAQVAVKVAVGAVFPAGSLSDTSLVVEAALPQPSVVVRVIV